MHVQKRAEGSRGTREEGKAVWEWVGVGEGGGIRSEVQVFADPRW